MVTDCTVREYDISNGENKTVADKIKALINDGYSVTLLYSAAGLKSMVVIGTKAEEETSGSDNSGEENAGSGGSDDNGGSEENTGSGGSETPAENSEGEGT